MAKIFIGATRVLKWKNLERLRRAFAVAQKSQAELVLDLENRSPAEFLEKIKTSYAVILVSLGDISPNFILEAIRAGKPFILTNENGLENRLGGLGLRVDPENEVEIAAKILDLCQPEVCREQVEKIKTLNFKHTWSEMAQEFLTIRSKV